MLALSLSFFAIALLYASVGFGGGSSYIALLSLNHTPFELIPKISLLCNLLVVSGGTVLYSRRGLIRWNLALPLVLSSVPFAILGGWYPVQERTFLILLCTSLFLSGIRILFIKTPENEMGIHAPPWPGLVITGIVLGALAGAVGIGGGIFLSPLMLNLRWARAKEVAAISSFFILLNSLGGLIGQWLKQPSLPELPAYLWLFVAVVVGGQIGSRMVTHQKMRNLWIQRATGILILFVSSRLALKLLS